MAEAKASIIGIDTGRTFTDVVVMDLNDYVEDALPSGEPYIGEYHEYSCPGCRVPLQVDLFCPAMGGDPIPWDTRIDV